MPPGGAVAVRSVSVSVDGYMEGPNREIDWHMVDEELHRHMNGWLAGAGGFLWGPTAGDRCGSARRTGVTGA